MPDIQARSVLGVPCKSAGLFLAIRSMIAERGFSVDGLRPSSGIAEYSASATPLIYEELVKLQPSLLSKSVCKYRHDPLIEATLLLIVSIVFAPFAFAGYWVGLFFPVFFGGFTWLWWKSSKLAAMPPKSVTFEDIGTFRELCLAILPARTDLK